MDKGSPNGEQYVVHGEGDQIPDIEPGDVVVVIKIRQNKIFARKGADLLMDKEIPLIEALTGLDFVLPHLDGRKVRIQTKPGEIISPDQLMTCEGLGLPFHKTPYKHGNLFIKFNIKFPERLDEAQVQAANTIFANQQKSETQQREIDGADEKVTMEKFRDDHKNTQAAGGTRAHGSDEEGSDDEGNVRVGCPQQ